MPETKFIEKKITLSPDSQPPGLQFPAKLAYRTFGNPSDPAILLPTCFGGKLEDTTPFLYSTEHNPNLILPPSRFFLVITGLLGGGESSSPSNTAEPYSGPSFPRTTYEDNVRLQYALCQSLSINKLFACIGFSMGGQQAFHMSAIFPDFVENLVCLAGSAKTSWHNWCVLDGMKHTLTHSSDFQAGHYEEQPSRGMKSLDRVFSAWALSHEWFRQRTWEKAGFQNLEDYLEEDWSGSGDANDLALLLWTWQHGDITLCYPEDEGDLEKTLGRIQARCLIMPSRTDQFFPPEDSEEEVKHLKRGAVSCIESVWGHIAGGGNGTEQDTDFIIKKIGEFLSGGS